MNSASILLVDDDAPFRTAMRKVLGRKGYVVDEAKDGAQASEKLGRGTYAAVLLDLKMPRVDGLEVLRRWMGSGPTFIMLTGHGTIETAVEAMRLGATSFLQKPFENEHLLALLEDNLRERSEGGAEAHRLVGDSDVMKRVRQLLDRVAPTDETVCIQGETGTGKELAARTLHERSGRAKGPFIAVNCACINRELFESELFGHVRGAFTGAHDDRPGLYREAEGGTLFIDEVGELPLECQAKLLRVLETRRIRRVGGSEELPADVRVVAATNRDLSAEVRAGRFREDLYFRLQVVPIVLPPLRDRPGDLEPLIAHLLKRVCATRPDAPPSLDAGALRVLEGYDWPGNVRELLNVLKRLVLFASTPTVGASDVVEALEGSIFRYTPRGAAPAPVAAPPTTVAPGPAADVAPAAPPAPGGPEAEAGAVERSLEDIEREHITRLYDHLEGNVTRLAKVLGIDRRTLQRKLRGYGFPPRQ